MGGTAAPPIYKRVASNKKVSNPDGSNGEFRLASCVTLITEQRILKTPALSVTFFMGQFAPKKNSKKI
jgi:hypothetical protein